jgi:MULE transposase domain
MDVLSALPGDTYHVRHILFNLPMPFSLSQANHKLFWPLIDNVYSIRTSNDVNFRKKDSRPAHVRHYVICRFKRARAAPSASQGVRASSTKRVLAGCGVSFHLLAFPDHYEYHPTSQSDSLDLITCSRHSHSLDESDANKRNSLLRALVGAEVAKGYHPAAIISSLTGDGRPNTRALLATAGGAYLSRQDVINAGLTWRLANPNQLWAHANVKNNVSLQGIEALETLASLGWLASQISATSLDHVDGRGIVFADPACLRTLEAHGYLSLVDSTHKTNQLEWKLFTLMVRDKYASWHPVAHGLLSHEFGELIAELLLAIKRWCNWQLRYVLSDDSGAEQRAFRLAFPGLVRGEMEVSKPAITLFLIRPLIALRFRTYFAECTVCAR